MLYPHSMLNKTLQLPRKNTTLTFKGTPEDLQSAWSDYTIKPSMKGVITRRLFKQAPQDAEQFFCTLDRLCTENELKTMHPKTFWTVLSAVFKATDPKPETKTGTPRVDRRTQQVQELLQDVTPPKSYLDVGSSGGSITASVASSLGLDANSAFGVDVVPPENENPEFSFKLYDGVKLPFDDNSQELITLFSVLHHVVPLDKVLQEIHRVLKPGGSFIVRDFDTKNPSVKLFNRVMDDLWYKVLLPNPDVPLPENFHSKEQWLKRFDDLGFILKNESFEKNNPYNPFMLRLTK